MESDDTGVVDRWLYEDSFVKADAGGQGFVQRQNFLNLGYEVFEEKYGRDGNSALQVILNLNARLQGRSDQQRMLSAPVIVYSQNLLRPDFQPPTVARRG